MLSSLTPVAPLPAEYAAATLYQAANPGSLIPTDSPPPNLARYCQTLEWAAHNPVTTANTAHLQWSHNDHGCLPARQHTTHSSIDLRYT